MGRTIRRMMPQRVSRCGVMWTLPPTISTLNPSGTGIRSSRSNHSSRRWVLASAMAIPSSRTVIVALLPG
ncbi:hypothetical protein EV562_11076 [Streptomyces sp. BK208]|nr:hypothetical protein EV562_11076 [Streptomyces sp. BK208]